MSELERMKASVRQELLQREFDRRALLKGAGGVGLSATVLGSVLSACDSGSDSSSSTTTSQAGPPKTGGTLNYAWNFPPGQVLNPQGAVSNNGQIWTQMQIYDQLVELLPGSLDLQPGIAEKWEASDDGLTYTFQIRDAEFSNGDKITIDDVKFSLDRFADTKLNGYAFLSAVESTKIVDSKTVEVQLSYPQGAFLDNISIFCASIIPKAVVEDLGEEGFNAAPIGSGAFIVKERDPGQTLTLARNPNYWREGKPYLDEVVFNFVEDDNARILQVTGGQAQAASPIPYSQLERVENASGCKLQVEPLGAVANINVNNRKAPLDEKEVRLALNYATPRDAILANVFFGKAEIANSHISKLKFWDESVAPYVYDEEKAREVLGQSSVPDGFEVQYTFIGTDADSRQIATILQDAWGKIGVKLSLEQVDPATWLDRKNKFDFELLAGAVDEFTSDVAVDDELATIVYDPASLGFGGYTYDNKEAQEILASATQTADEDERQANFSKLQTFGMEEDPPWVPLVFAEQRTGLREEVQGLQTLVTGWWRLEDVWLSE